jgi:hypothetical protein
VHSYLLTVCSEHVLITGSNNYFQEMSNGLPFHEALGLAHYSVAAVVEDSDDD